jgi:AAA domain, putative AbiEii toxin, Type IV TA system
LPKAPPAITSLSVSGFKSIVDEQTIEIRPLTLLAGANSSGKSSMMQPLLLLKQTLEAPYDPGPLLLSGPNVRFTSARQFYPAAARTGRATAFTVKIRASDEKEFAVGFRWGETNKGSFSGFNDIKFEDKPLTIDENLTIHRFIEYLRISLPPGVLERTEGQLLSSGLQVKRDKFFFDIDLGNTELFFLLAFGLLQFREAIAQLIMQLIHMPGLRGNPARTYSVTGVGPSFPGTFEYYVASLIASWNSETPEKLRDLNDDLKILGLTWKIEATAIDDTQVELRVGRLPRPKQGGAHDFVSIADVGFGVSQTLPVVVALRAANPGQLVYIEQPEIHLHPRAQVAMARLLVDAANRGVRVVAETHSSLLLLAVQTLVAEGEIDPGLVGLNWFLRGASDGATRIEMAELDEAGRFGDWPEDFDQVALEAESRYLSAAENRLAKE